jgi:hypothetical protein
MNEIYLGDGAYANVDPSGYGFWVWTSNGIERTNEIFLEPVGALALINLCMSTFEPTIKKAIKLLNENNSKDAQDVIQKLKYLI